MRPALGRYSGPTGVRRPTFSPAMRAWPGEARGGEEVTSIFPMHLIPGGLFTHSLEQPFGLIGAFDAIEHLDDNDNSCAASGKLRPGGHLIITVPAHISLWCYFDEVVRHHRRYAPVEMEYTLTAPGFTVVQATQFLARSFRPPGSSGARSASGGEPLASQRAATPGRDGV